jgi:hypothetical protein
MPEHAPKQHELPQPYLGGARVHASNEEHIPELGQGHSFDGFEEQLEDDENSVLSEAPAEAPTQAPKEAPRHLDIAADLDNRLILQGTRTRKPSAKAAGLATATCLHNYAVPLFVARCFATSIIEAPSATKDNPNLPPEPANAKQAYVHRFAERWVLAEGEEYKAHNENGTWEIVVTLPAGIFALPTKWVYKYKFDEMGKLIRFKARLVVCGNR